MLAIGNPDNPASHFATICKPGSGWKALRIDGLRTPNFTEEAVAAYPALARYMEDEGIPYSTEEVPETLRPLLLDPQWVDERIKRWGVKSPMFASKVRGEFPEVGDDSLVSPKWIREAQLRTIEPNGRPVLGVDIARYGADETVIYRREGGHVRLHSRHSKESTMLTAGRVIHALRSIAAELTLKEFPYAIVDEVGVGAGVYDRLAEQNQPVKGVNGASAAVDKDNFVNARAERFWNLREAFERGEIDIDPDDDDLANQLQAIRWTFNSRGQIQIESKDDMKKRGLPSPDRADALCYAWIEGLAPDVDVEAHTTGPSITGDLMEAEW